MDERPYASEGASYEEARAQEEAISKSAPDGGARAGGSVLVRDVAALSPIFHALLLEHETDNGEILAHVFFGVDLYPNLSDLFDAAPFDVGVADDLRRLFDLLEARLIAGDPDECNVIAVSFLEHTPQLPDPQGRMRLWLGPRLTRELAELDHHRRESLSAES